MKDVIYGRAWNKAIIAYSDVLDNWMARTMGEISDSERQDILADFEEKLRK